MLRFLDVFSCQFAKETLRYPDQRGDANAVGTESMPAKKNSYRLDVYAPSRETDGSLVFLIPFVEDETGRPKQDYYTFAHRLQTFTPFYRKEDGVEYFDVPL